jgi:bacteriorhodopsin
VAKGRPEDCEQMRTSISSLGLLTHACLFLGVIFAVLGVISYAVNFTLGLEIISWLLPSIVAFLFGVLPIVSWVLAGYLDAISILKT